jgi:hypothetical protein
MAAHPATGRDVGGRLSSFRDAFALAAVVVALLAACGASSSSGSAASAASGGSASGGSGWAHLVIVYRPHGRYPAPGQTDRNYRWTLSCGPPRGNHPARAAACFELAHHEKDLSAGGPQCLVIIRGGRSASVTGDVRGASIQFVASTCSPAWRTLPALLTGSVSRR